MEQTRPLVFVLTDGSGSSGDGRIASTSRLLAHTSARAGSIYGRLSDRAIYAAMLARDAVCFIDLADELVELYEDVIAEHSTMVDDLAAEQRAAAVYLQSLAPRLHQRDLLRAACARLLRLPIVGTLIRNRAGRELGTHWFPELLRSMDRD